jgi:hypothetical protein
MARDPQSGSFNSKVVDEQTKAQAMRDAAPKATTKPPTNNAEMIAQANALIAKLQGAVETGEKSAIEIGALNPSVIKKAEGESNLAFLARKKATEDLARQNAMADNPLLNKAVKPTDAPAGQYYAWIGGTNTGQWQLYNIPGYGSTRQGKGDFSSDGGPGSGSGGDTTVTKTYTASDGKEFTDQQAFVDYEISLRETGTQAKLIADQNKAERKSAYDLLLSEFDRYGLSALVTPLKSLIEEGVSPSEFTLRLRETDAYKKRFAANAQRVAKGLRALSEAEYIGTEDQYQDVMRRYGMPETYYAKGDLGIQSGFEKFLAGDVSAVELEDRIQTAQNRVVNSNPEVSKALKQFYPGISNGDILSYVLDPTNAIENIKRKVTAAEIGGAAIQSGLQAGVARAEELGAAGITKQQAQSGFGTIAGGLQRGSQLASIYGEDPYSQAIAETEVFGLAGAQEAAKQRKKITGLERATFSGQSGASSGALARDRAGAY